MKNAKDFFMMGCILFILILMIVSMIDINNRMYESNKRIEEIEGRSQTRYNNIDDKLDDIHSRMDAIENGMTELVQKEIRKVWNSLHDHIEEIEDEIDGVREAKAEKRRQQTAQNAPQSHENDEVEQSDTGNANGSYLGTYTLTAYEETGSPCANGNYPTRGYTVACNSLPLGTRIYIEGYGEYVVEDRGGMGGGVIDIYLGDPDECIQFGRRSANVYIVN